MTTQTQIETPDLNAEAKGEDQKEIVQEIDVKVSPAEQAAREAGWVSKDEWIAQGKNPDDWRSAKEFQERGELFEEIHKLKDNNKKTAAAFKALVEHHKKVREIALKEAIEKLKAEKRVALENHEIDRVYEIDEKIEQVKATPVELPNVEVPEVETGPTPVFKKWHKRNSWYELSGDDEASRIADTIGLTFKKKNPDATEEELLEHVESKIARRFPELFENQTGTRVSEVNPRGGKPPSEGVFKMTEAEERVCQMLVAQGAMTRKEYIEELKKTRG